MEDIKNNILFDDKELEELEDKEATISSQKQKELNEELDDYFSKNKIGYEE